MAEEPQELQELQTLRGRVQQLEAERDRMRQEQAAARTGPQAAAQPGPSSRGMQEDLGTADRIVYLPRERKCPIFRGTHGIGINEWEEEVRISMRVRHVGLNDQASFIFDHLEGEARDEIRYRPTAERENPERVFAILKELYGCQKPYVSLQEDFFSRRQLDGETLQEFSHALFCLMEKVVACSPHRMTNSPTLLRDQFVENVINPDLRRELKRFVRTKPACTLLDVRAEALSWEREGGVGDGRINFHSVPTLCSSQTVSMQPQVSDPPFSDTTASQLAALIALVQTQQEQLAQITQTLVAMRQPSEPRSPRPSSFVCHRCQQPGHIARYCNARVRARSTPSTSSPPQVFAANSTQLTEN